MSDDVKWLSYDEIAVAFGVTRESARQLVIRKRWARRKGNEVGGRALIGVPVELLQARTSDDTSDRTSDDTSHRPSDDTSDRTSDDTSAIQVLTRHIERIEREREAFTARVKELESQVDTERRRVLELTADAGAATALRETVATLRSALDGEKQRAGELRQDRDRWMSEATRPRGLRAWFGRS